ncbi:MAG: hypothetical protein WCL50_09100 [Spirochaetota bacterium]
MLRRISPAASMPFIWSHAYEHLLQAQGQNRLVFDNQDPMSSIHPVFDLPGGDGIMDSA